MNIEETDHFLKKDSNKLIYLLQQCKFQGSWDTKIDLNIVINTITRYQLLVEDLKKLNNELKIKLLNKDK